MFAVPIVAGFCVVVGIGLGVGLLRRKSRQPLNTNDDDDDEPLCAICLEPPPADQMARTQCNHCYCLPCFKSWEEKQVQRRSVADFFASAVRCPLCMAAVTQLSTSEQTFVAPTAAQRQQADDEMKQRLRAGLNAFADDNLDSFVPKERSAENDARRTALSPAANNVVLRAPLEPLPCGARVVISERGVRKMVMTIRRLIHGEESIDEVVDRMHRIFVRFRGYALPLRESSPGPTTRSSSRRPQHNF